MENTNNELSKKELRKQKLDAKKAAYNIVIYVKYSFSSFIIKFERKCFDWHYVGRNVDDTVESATVTESGKVKLNHKIVKYARFERPKVYQKNFLFSLTELISKFISFFRRLAISFSPIVIIACIVLAFMGSTSVILPVCIVYAVLIAASILFALLGKLWIKVFKLNEKTNEILEKNGYVAWDEDYQPIKNENNYY